MIESIQSLLNDSKSTTEYWKKETKNEREELKMAKAKNGAFFTQEQMSPMTQAEVEGFAKISKDIKKDVVNLSLVDMRNLVDIYYQIQKVRIATGNQISAIKRGTDGEGYDPNSALVWTNQNMAFTEKQLQDMMLAFVKSQSVGRWMLKVKGIGPVLAAALLANLDVTKCEHFNQFQSFCGLNDNNNPWYGKEKADKIVKAIYEELQEEDKDVALAIVDRYDVKAMKTFEKQMKDMFKSYSKQNEYASKFESVIALGELESYVDVDMRIIGTLHNCFENDSDRVADFLLRSYSNKNLVTATVYQKTVEKTRRKLATIHKGTMISANSTAGKYVVPTSSSLKSYLAKPPYNTNLKKICYLIGESFIKVKGRGSLYGRLYEERKAFETARNEEGYYAEQAAQYLQEKNWGKDTESYKAYIEGKLPKIQLHRRALRYAVKMFISHLWEAMYIAEYGHRPEAQIYPIEYMGHTDYLEPEVPYSVLAE